VLRPTVGAIVDPTALMHQNNAITTAATVRAVTPLSPSSAALFLRIEKLDNPTSADGDSQESGNASSLTRCKRASFSVPKLSQTLLIARMDEPARSTLV
jgi:hypothetical protein